MNNSSTILLTGATGFLGSHLLVALLAKGYEVVAVKRSFSDVSKIKDVLGHAKLHFFDIELENPQSLFEEYSLDITIHTATEYGRGLVSDVKCEPRCRQLGMQGTQSL